MFSYFERTDKNTLICTTTHCLHTLKHLQQPPKPNTCHISAIVVYICSLRSSFFKSTSLVGDEI